MNKHTIESHHDAMHLPLAISQEPTTCPFCGGPAKVEYIDLQENYPEDNFWSVTCDPELNDDLDAVCDSVITVFGDTRAAAVRRWNTRTAPTIADPLDGLLLAALAAFGDAANSKLCATRHQREAPEITEAFRSMAATQLNKASTLLTSASNTIDVTDNQ